MASTGDAPSMQAPERIDTSLSLDMEAISLAEDGSCPPGAALATRDVIAEVAARLDRRSVGALRATCAAVRSALDATLRGVEPPHAAPIPRVCALLARLPALQELSLAACADGMLSACRSLADADAALAPLADTLQRRLPQLASLTLPLPALLQLGDLAWARAWAAGADAGCGGGSTGSGSDTAAARAAVRSATRGRYAGVYRALEHRPHAVLPLPGVPLAGARCLKRLAVARASGCGPAWPDDQPTAVWLDPTDACLGRLEALAIEHACLVHVPPPVLALAARRGGALRELRLHGCQIRSLPNSAVAHLTALTSLQLSGNFLKALPEAVSSLTSLRDLDVSRNALASLCRGLGGLSALTSLDASSNQLLALPRCLSGLSGLQRLALSHNWLSGAPELGRMCGAWPYLTELRLANVTDKHGALAVPAAALADGCPALAVLDVSAQFALDAGSLAGLSQCRALRLLELPYEARREGGGEALRALRAAFPGLVIA